MLELARGLANSKKALLWIIRTDSNVGDESTMFSISLLAIFRRAAHQMLVCMQQIGYRLGDKC